MWFTLLAGGDADHTGKTGCRIFDVVVVDVGSVGVSTTGVFIGTGTENPRKMVKQRVRFFCHQSVT